MQVLVGLITQWRGWRANLMQAPVGEVHSHGPEIALAGWAALSAESEAEALTLQQQEARSAMVASGPVADMEVDELRRSVQDKNNEIALLLHLANNTTQVPISAELSEELSAAVASKLGSRGQDMQTWLQKLEDERQRMATEHQQQASST